MSPLKIVLGFAPWIAYVLVVTVAGPHGVPVAAVLALLVAVGLVVQSLSARQAPKLLAVAAAVIFAVYTAAALTTPALDAFLAAYGRALAAIVLAAAILVLLPVLPFTEQFARESVPRQFWATPRFRALNRRISAVWAGAIAGSGIANAVSETFRESGGEAHRGVLPLLLRIGVPVLLFIAAIRYTERATGNAGGDAGAHDQAGAGHHPSDRR